MRAVPEVDAEHPDVVRAAAKMLVVGDADAIDVGVDCDVLKRGCMPLATSRHKKSERPEKRRREGAPNDKALLTT